MGYGERGVDFPRDKRSAAPVAVRRASRSRWRLRPRAIAGSAAARAVGSAMNAPQACGTELNTRATSSRSWSPGRLRSLSAESLPTSSRVAGRQTGCCLAMWNQPRMGGPNTPLDAPFRQEVQSFVGHLEPSSQGRAGARLPREAFGAAVLRSQIVAGYSDPE
jgi:hypothetical protein